MNKISSPSAEKWPGPSLRKPVNDVLTIEELPRKAGRRDLWRRQCEVLQSLGRNRFEIGFTIEEGNEALIAAGLPTLNGEQMDHALKGQPSDADT